jgi:signal transduction histidine kinase
VPFSAFWLLGAALAGLGLLVLKGGRDKPVNRSFAFFTLGLAGWVLGIGGLAQGGLPQTWGRFTFASASIVPAAFLSFARAYPTPGRWPPWGVRGTAWGLGALLALASMTTHLVVQPESPLGATPFHRTSGPLYPVFAAYFLAASIVGIGVFLAKWRKARGLQRAQLYYLAIGLGIATAGAVTTNLLVPLVTGHSRYSVLGPYFLLPLVLLVGHAIIRHRLLDLRMVIHRSVAFAAAILLAWAAVWGLLLLMLSLPTGRVALPVGAVILLTVTAIGLSAPVAPRLARLVDAYLLRGRPDLDRALQEAARGLFRFLTIHGVTAELRRILESTLVPETLMILTEAPDGGGVPITLASLPGDGRSLEAVAAMAWAMPGPVPAVRLLGEAPHQDDRSREVEEILRLTGVEVWIGLGRAGQRLGVVLLGPRRSGEAYLAPALQFLEDLAEVASMAVEAAALHAQQLLLQREAERLAHLARLARVYAGLAHEIRTPLTTISNLVSLMAERLDDPDYRDLIVRVVPAEVARIVKLAERLRALAPDTTRPAHPIALHTVLADIVSMLAPVAEQQGLKLILEVAPDVPPVAGDVDQLVPLFQNLLRNAMEATPPGGRISVRAWSDGARARVQVIDEGAGLDPALRESLFEPFVTTKPSGLGLGLSICQELAQAHGAQLSLTNRSDGSGAIAELVFPPTVGRPATLTAGP